MGTELSQRKKMSSKEAIDSSGVEDWAWTSEAILLLVLVTMRERRGKEYQRDGRAGE